MNSGVTSSLSPNQNASTSLRPMPAFATSRILDSSRFWMAWRIAEPQYQPAAAIVQVVGISA